MSDTQSFSNTDSPPLSECVIREHLSSSVDINSIDILPSVNSTNSYLLEQPILLGRAKVCLAEAQISGRGRRGNDWESAANKNIMLSLSWGFQRWPETISGLGLAVALVVAERLNQDYQIGVGIKWPNDLLINGDKLAGILVDVTGRVDGVCNVVLGLGLNIHQPDWSEGSAGYAWTDMRSHGVFVDRNLLAANIVQDCLAMLKVFEEQGFAVFVKRWNALSCHIKQQVVLSEAGEDNEVSGSMVGVDHSGALVIDSNDGQRRAISNSNLSLRLAS